MTTYREVAAQGQAEVEAQREAKRTPAERRSRQTFHGAVRWCRENLPDEHPQIAAAAALTVKASGQAVTPEAVRARLEGQDRHAEALRERGLNW